MYFGKAYVFADDGTLEDLYLIKLFNKRYFIHDETLYKVISYKKNDNIIPVEKNHVCVELDGDPIFSLRRNK